ncbi:MAG: SRPBCC family protein [Mesonia sp.]|tara:strand:- start:36745 stop:37194 length:450 start_codon:yes stop_codon:yes gene_type:complete
MKRNIKLEWFFDYSPEQIWECLTNPELLKEWMGIQSFKAEVGFEFTQKQKPKPAMKWDGMMYHTVLEVVPIEKLSYSFQGGPKPGVITLDTIVTWRLSPKKNGTVLVLEHTGFEGAKNILSSMFMELGWKNHIAKKFKKALKAHYYEKN